MSEPIKSSSTQDRRGGDRTPLDGEVAVTFPAHTIVGPGQNISPEGVFFVADGSVRVLVRLDGVDEERVGEVVRIEAMGNGKVGLAIRFVARTPN